MNGLVCWSATLLLGCVLLLGCGGDDDGDGGGGTAGGGADLPAIECDSDTPSYEEVTLFGTCVLCHASTKAAGIARQWRRLDQKSPSEPDLDPCPTNRLTVPADREPGGYGVQCRSDGAEVPKRI